MPLAKGLLEASRFEIAYRIFGDKGRHLICVNGAQQSMAMWQTFVRRFCRDYRIVLFDFPNQGKSRVLSGPANVSLDEQAAILSAVAKATGLDQEAAICAASWGGIIALVFAAKYPGRVKKLILASVGTKPNKKLVETIKKGFSMDMGRREEMAQLLIDSFGDALPEQLKRGIVSQFRTMTEERLRAFCEHGSFVISSRKLNEVIDLGSIKAKTVLLRGANDTIIDLDDVKFLASQIPDCSIKVVSGVGHFLHMEREDVLDIYADILAQ
ncbi:MAG: alpha/beta hydrolase [Candidatus Omnitrophota bacterium]|nr:alpha/beta hydrolase [Candidatus Omnitrophota bacterium]